MSERPWFLYVICESGAEETGPCKIGTASNVKYRIDGMKCGNWRPLEIQAIYASNSRSEAIRLESKILASFGDRRLAGRDWVKATPAQILEAFSLNGKVPL